MRFDDQQRPDQGDPETLYPAECHVRIIAEQRPDVAERISAVLRGLDVTEPLEKGRASAGGKYATYQLTLWVDSRERMRELDNALAAIEGVRMVL
jgi:putative lipoic acid-binding regulatory protein